MQMRPILKTGILAVLLVVPVLVFLFLKLFGRNHYELRRYVPVQVDSTMVDGGYRYDTVWHKVPDFNLTAHTGKPFSQADLKGKIYVADFFFATCQTICPKMAKQMNRVQDMFRNQDAVKLVSYTVNPAQDSVPVLAAYAKEQEALPGKWTFLTGDKKDIYHLARKGYYLPAGEGDGGPDDFIHSDMLVLVDRDKNIRGYYHGTDPKDVDRLILEIRILLHEYKLD
jgi:protein SCO1/2